MDALDNCAITSYQQDKFASPSYQQKSHEKPRHHRARLAESQDPLHRVIVYVLDWFPLSVRVADLEALAHWRLLCLAANVP